MLRVIMVSRGLCWRPGQAAVVFVDEDDEPFVGATWEPDAGQPMYHRGREVPGTLVLADGTHEVAVLLGVTYQD